jgi:hypothetical protein
MVTTVHCRRTASQLLIPKADFSEREHRSRLRPLPPSRIVLPTPDSGRLINDHEGPALRSRNATSMNICAGLREGRRLVKSSARVIDLHYLFASIQSGRNIYGARCSGRFAATFDA